MKKRKKIPTFAEARAVPYHQRSAMEHFVFYFDPGRDAHKFRRKLDNIIKDVRANDIDYFAKEDW